MCSIVRRSDLLCELAHIRQGIYSRALGGRCRPRATITGARPSPDKCPRNRAAVGDVSHPRHCGTRRRPGWVWTKEDGFFRIVRRSQSQQLWLLPSRQPPQADKPPRPRLVALLNLDWDYGYDRRATVERKPNVSHWNFGLSSAKRRCEFGERDGTRTHDLLIKSQLLYRLSYALVTWRMIISENQYRPIMESRTSFSGSGASGLCRGARMPGQ